MGKPESLRPRSVHHVELMSQCQDLELQGRPIAEGHADGQEQRDNDGSHRRTLTAQNGKVNVFKKNEFLGRHTCDVTDEASVQTMVNATIGRYGALHGSFNNAGVGGGRRPLHDLDAGKFDAVIATNLRGVFLCVKYEIAAMLECGGGSAVVTSSVGGLVGAQNNSDYAA